MCLFRLHHLLIHFAMQHQIAEIHHDVRRFLRDSVWANQDSWGLLVYSLTVSVMMWHSQYRSLNHVLVYNSSTNELVLVGGY